MTGWLVVAALATVAGVALAWTGWRPPRPAVEVTMRRLRRTPLDTAGGERRTVVRVGRSVHERVSVPAEWTRMLHLVGRTPEAHLGLLAVVAVAGAVVPALVLGVLQWSGLLSLQLWVPLALMLVSALVAALVLHADTRSRAEQMAVDLRHQLGAYLDMVTMLLAGNSGYEGALEQAARAGDGALFDALSRRMRETTATGRSAVVALERVADDYGLVELDQVAATIALSAAEGAPVARSLTAKCTTLRSTLAAEQEAAVRIRTDKVTPPLVGMALLFMALIIYPALDLT